MLSTNAKLLITLSILIVIGVVSPEVFTFVSNIVGYLAWPTLIALAFYMYGDKIIPVLVKKLEDLIEWGDKGPKFKQVGYKKGIEKNYTSDSSEIYQQQEQLILNDLIDRVGESADDQLKLLVKSHAITSIRVKCERLNAYIYGSQVKLLDRLKESKNPILESDVMMYYIEAKTRYKDVYKTYSFEEWLNFLISFDVLEKEKGKYTIKDFGLVFLSFLDQEPLGKDKIN